MTVILNIATAIISRFFGEANPTFRVRRQINNFAVVHEFETNIFHLCTLDEETGEWVSYAEHEDLYVAFHDLANHEAGQRPSWDLGLGY